MGLIHKKLALTGLLNFPMPAKNQRGRNMKFKKILNPVDGSEHSMRATQYSIELAKQFDSKIILLHCHARFPIVLAEPQFQNVLNEIMKNSEELIKPFEDLLEESGVEYEIRILEGSPAKNIDTVVNVEKINLIVMGSRGVGNIEGLFLGSVAHQVLHKVQCPVFIIK
ncbi:universal stress protein [Desulfobacter hydrogenophilus]|uniref:Universal stress protein n=2 Tax=Desulfobacter hydrogenophilus TaxID=2291 RepID=A0A328FBN3_9BACT|nr:universal stress protein [Desulfobacter hydrogenophilus]QBH11479.1 universal stress protein [Desulfobacter hydrogenophilus]RAM01978.1 universal stress protein [Desulfobacter hydrogenophilus]